MKRTGDADSVWIVEFDTSRDDALDRLAVDGNGSVNSAGNYQRRTTLTAVKLAAERDDEATVRRIEQ